MMTSTTIFASFLFYIFCYKIIRILLVRLYWTDDIDQCGDANK